MLSKKKGANSSFLFENFAIHWRQSGCQVVCFEAVGWSIKHWWLRGSILSFCADFCVSLQVILGDFCCLTKVHFYFASLKFSEIIAESRNSMLVFVPVFLTHFQRTYFISWRIRWTKRNALSCMYHNPLDWLGNRMIKNIIFKVRFQIKPFMCLELLLARYARKLLHQQQLKKLIIFGKKVSHDLRPWLVRER